MIISGGKILAIDLVRTDKRTISGDGLFKPLGVINGDSFGSWSSISGQVPYISGSSDLTALNTSASASIVNGAGLYTTITGIGKVITSSYNSAVNYTNEVSANITSAISSTITPNVSADTELGDKNCFVMIFGNGE